MQDEKLRELDKLLKIVQVHRKMTMEQIAKEIGYSRPYLSAAVNGKLPDVSEIIEKLRIRFAELFEGGVERADDGRLLREVAATTRVTLSVLAELLAKETSRPVAAVMADLSKAVRNEAEGLDG